MRIGLLARGESRGLAHLTWEFYRHLGPARTLLVDLGELARGFPIHPGWYPDATTICWDGAPLDDATEGLVRDWLTGLDVVLTFETWYDHRIVGWARDAGVATVQLVMPEFWRADLELPDAVWAPTSWRLDQLPESTRLVPVPVALDRFAGPDIPGDGPLRVLHVAGHRAAADRNGTQYVTRALVEMRGPVHVTITGQDARLPATPARRRGGPVTVEKRPTGVADYWDLYAGQDVLLLPRRYGGLSLPVQEGMAAGLVPVLPDVPPNGDWPAVLTPSKPTGTIATPGGVLRMAGSRPRDLAAAVDALASDRGLLGMRRRLALEWARAHSWEALGPLWMDELARAM